MKTLLICSPSHALFGGVETIVNDISRELPSRGWKVLLALAKGNRFNNVEAYRRQYSDLPIVEIDGTKGTRQGRLEGLYRIIQNAQPDVVLSARIVDAYEVVANLKRRNGLPRLAVTVQAYEAQYIYDAWLYRNCIDLCVTSGQMIREALVHWSKLPPERVESIPGGVRLPNLPVIPREKRTPIRLGYVGRLEQEQKRIFDLVPFLEALDSRGIPYELSIVGTGPEAAELTRRLEPWIQTGQVRILGWQNQESLYSHIFPSLDCLIHFAHTEGVTIAPREAMAHGVVPIISQFIGLKTEGQFVHGVNSLTFPVGDTNAAVDNVVKLMEKPGLLSRLSQNAIHSQKGIYTFEGSMDAWAESFNRCLSDPPLSGPAPRLPAPMDGRLSQLKIPPRIAQRIRDLLGKRHIHNDPGSEWPTGIGWMTSDVFSEILKFAFDWEQRIVDPTPQVVINNNHFGIFDQC